jgi:hypothetical protein
MLKWTPRNSFGGKPKAWGYPYLSSKSLGYYLATYDLGDFPF